MDSVRCPRCGKEIRLIRYGYGWIGNCCDTIVNNRERDTTEGARSGSDIGDDGGECGTAKSKKHEPS